MFQTNVLQYTVCLLFLLFWQSVRLMKQWKIAQNMFVSSPSVSTHVNKAGFGPNSLHSLPLPSTPLSTAPTRETLPPVRNWPEFLTQWAQLHHEQRIMVLNTSTLHGYLLQQQQKISYGFKMHECLKGRVKGKTSDVHCTTQAGCPLKMIQGLQETSTTPSTLLHNQMS